jgi:valyl-tRNA synthetase
MPFVTEELWQAIRERKPLETIMRAPMPEAATEFINTQVESEMRFVQDVIDALRNIRGEMNIAPSKEISLVMKLSGERRAESIERYAGYLKRLARVTSLTFVQDSARPNVAASAVVQGEELFVPLEGLIDIEAEKARLKKEIDRVAGLVKTVQSKLSNSGFTDKAPKEVVEKEREKLNNFAATVEKLQRSFDALS